MTPLTWCTHAKFGNADESGAQLGGDDEGDVVMASTHH